MDYWCTFWTYKSGSPNTWFPLPVSSDTAKTINANVSKSTQKWKIQWIFLMYTTTYKLVFLSKSCASSLSVNQWLKNSFTRQEVPSNNVKSIFCLLKKRQPLCTSAARNQFPTLFSQIKKKESRADPGYFWWLAAPSNKTQCVGVHILRSGLIFFLHLKVCMKTPQPSMRDQRGRMGREER